MVAGDGREQMIDALLDGLRAVEGRKLIRKITQHPGNACATERARNLAHQDGAVAETIDHQAGLSKKFGRIREPFSSRGIEFDKFGHQQGLGGDGSTRIFDLKLLVDDTLMRGMLVDNDDAVAGLADNVVLMELRARDAQRVIWNTFR